MIIGNLSAFYIDRSGLHKVIKSFIVSATFLNFIVYVQFFMGKDTLSTQVYAYASKNSISLIIATAILLHIFEVSNLKKTKREILNIVILAANFTILLILRSRTCIVGLLFSITIFLISKRNNIKIKKYIYFGLIVCLILLIFNQNFYDNIINKILFAGRNSNDLDTLTSGRISIIKSFGQLIGDDILTGIGSIYYECAPLSAILQFGIIIGMIYILLMYFPLIYGYKMRQVSNEWNVFFSYSSLLYGK